MEQDKLKPTDLEAIAPERNRPATLGGRREISRELAKKLAERFNVGVSAFI